MIRVQTAKIIKSFKELKVGNLYRYHTEWSDIDNFIFVLQDIIVKNHYKEYVCYRPQKNDYITFNDSNTYILSSYKLEEIS